MLKWLVPTIVAVLAGLLVLIGVFLPDGILSDARLLLLEWVTVLGAFALLLAYSSLLRVHLKRVMERRTPLKIRLPSIILVLAAVVGLAVTVIQPSGFGSSELVKLILTPGRSALLALTAVVLLVAGMRIFHVRRDLNSVLFVAAAVLTLLATIPLGLRAWSGVMQVVKTSAAAGMRGILLGVALGVVVTGLRILVGIDRPHSQK